jgi:hypothetical protein
MHQASLYYHTGPELSEGLYHLRVTVYRKTVWAKTSRYQWIKEIQQLRLGALGDTVLTSYNRMSRAIHQADKAAGTAQECPIQYKMPVPPQIQGSFRRRSLQLIINHPVKLPLATTGLICQLPGRITFDNPVPKPLPFFITAGSIMAAPPAERMSAGDAKPALFAFTTMTISPKKTEAKRTEFFCP